MRLVKSGLWPLLRNEAFLAFFEGVARSLLQCHHYTVREPYTSKRCFCCKRPDAENEACRADQKGRPACGVMRCNRCGTSWSCDCLNIVRIAREHLAGLSRPEYLSVRGP